MVEKIGKSIGGMFMNFIVSPGQDTIIVMIVHERIYWIEKNAHLYSYDFDQWHRLFKRIGFDDGKPNELFESNDKDYQIPNACC